MRGLLIAFFVLSACGKDNSSDVAAHPFAKKWHQVNTSADWDWALASFGQAFSAPLTVSGETCACSVTLTGNQDSGSMVTSCSWQASSGSDPGCSSYNDRVLYQYDGTILAIYPTGGLGLLAEWR